MKILSRIKYIVYYKIVALLNLPFYYLLEHKGSVDKIRQLKNSHKGERCFIVCNGPSLTPEDLDTIYRNGDFAFGINIIGRIFPKTKWRPDVLLMTESGVFKKTNRETIKNSDAKIKILNSKDYVRSHFINGNKVFVRLNDAYSLLDNPEFSLDASKNITSIGCSTYQVINLAYYMGFKELYLIGCDMSYAINLRRDGTIYYNDSGKHHFYGMDKECSKTDVPVATWQQILAFEAAENFSHELGFRIYNATRGGCLETCERVDFDSLFPTK